MSLKNKSRLENRECTNVKNILSFGGVSKRSSNTYHQFLLEFIMQVQEELEEILPNCRTLQQVFLWISILPTQWRKDEELADIHLYNRGVYICDWLWQKQAVGLKISFVHFLLQLINNYFWLKCRKNYYSIFMGSRDMNFITLFYSEVQFREKRLQSLLL